MLPDFENNISDEVETNVQKTGQVLRSIDDQIGWWLITFCNHELFLLEVLWQWKLVKQAELLTQLCLTEQSMMIEHHELWSAVKSIQFNQINQLKHCFAVVGWMPNLEAKLSYS